MGLLNFNTDNLGENALLQAGLGILSNNQGHGGQFAPAFGQGTMQGLQQANEFKRRQQEALLRKQQMDMQQSQFDMQKEKNDRENAQRELQKTMFGDISKNYGLDPNILSVYPSIGENIIKDKLIPKPQKLGFAPNGIAYDENNPTLKVGENYSKQDPIDYNKPFLPNGMPNTAYQQFKLTDSAKGASNIINNNKISEKGYTKLAELDAETINDMGKNAKQAREALPMVDRMIRNEGNSFSGLFAPGLTGLAQTADALGFATPELKGKLVSTQLFSQGADAYAASMLKALMGSNQLSNADLGMVKKIAPRLADSPEARREIMLYARKRISDMQDEYQGARNYYDKNNASLTGFNPPIAPVPEMPALSNNAKTVTLKDVADTAKASGKTTKQVTEDLRNHGYVIGK